MTSGGRGLPAEETVSCPEMENAVMSGNPKKTGDLGQSGQQLWTTDDVSPWGEPVSCGLADISYHLTAHPCPHVDGFNRGASDLPRQLCTQLQCESPVPPPGESLGHAAWEKG